MRSVPFPTARRGSISIIVLIALPVLLLFVALAIFASQRNQARTELQGCADASSLAAALCLVDDCRLLGDEQAMQQMVARCRREAQLYALNNPVYGQPQKLHENANNDPAEDIVVGRQLHAFGDRFVPADANSSSDIFSLNAVQVRACRTRERGTPLPFIRGPMLSSIPTDMTLSSTALLDQAVIGLRPINTTPLYCAPIGLLSDPSGIAKRSWEHEVERRLGGSQLPRMEIRFGLRKGNACLLQIGTHSAEELTRQLIEGVRRDQLDAVGGELVLDRDGQLRLPGTLVGPECGGLAEQQLVACLHHLMETKERRVWPLYRAVDPETGQLVVTGFVAARVVGLRRAGKHDGKKDDDKHDKRTGERVDKHDGKRDDQHDDADVDANQLVITLEPTMMACPAVVTKMDRPQVRLEPPSNRYLCKVRLAP